MKPRNLFDKIVVNGFSAVTLLMSVLLTILIAAAVVRAAYAQISTARFTTFLALGWPKWIIAAFIAAGMIMILGFQLIGYGLAWVWWWLGRR